MYARRAPEGVKPKKAANYHRLQAGATFFFEKRYIFLTA
jgi:hypothetical protein